MTSATFARLGVFMTERSALHGVNLTGWLSLESWVSPDLFAGTGSLGERGLMDALGTTLYRELVHEHRDAFITEDDFASIARRGFNAVRIPVPWYVFGRKGPEPGPFVGCVSNLDKAMSWAERNDLSVLLVLAISPGRPNTDNDIFSAGRTSRETFLDVLEMLARRYGQAPALMGIEVADEPIMQQRKGLFGITEGMSPHALRNYYREAYAVIRAAAGDEPCVVLPDAGAPGAWRGFMISRRYHNVWLDCHLYHYADKLGTTGPAGAAELVRASRTALARAQHSGLPVMVGAWSAALPFADSLMTPEGRIALERVYCSEQIAAFDGLPGWFFQTWKTDAHLSGWDSRIALSSFERSMLG